MPSDKVLDLIGIAIGAFGAGVGAVIAGFWLWLTNRNKSKAEAVKALADAKKAQTEDHILADQAAFDSLLKSNSYLQERLLKQDNRIDELEKQIQVMKGEREKLVIENQELLKRYETFKTSIIKLFEEMIAEIARLEQPLVDTVRVIEIIKAAKEKLPKTGPLPGK
jgi:DNA repair exonuclease SbcCD ATPase subunit